MKEQITDLFGKITGESTGLGKLLEKIPGIDGYMERSRRREADDILRRTIAAKLEESRLQLSNVHQTLSGDIILAMDHAEPLGRADSRLMGLIGKIKDAPQGYAGFFDAIKIKEDDLARIYAFDEGMLGHVDAINEGIAALETAVNGSGDVAGGIRSLTTTINTAHSTFAERNEVMAGIQ